MKISLLKQVVRILELLALLKILNIVSLLLTPRHLQALSGC